MKDWQIAVLVVICVVFVVLLITLIFLIHRAWLARRNFSDDGVKCYPGCTPDKNILYFLDYNLQLHAINIKDQQVVDGAALQRCIAAYARAGESPELLSLAYVYCGDKDTSTCLTYAEVSSPEVVQGAVALDLDRLIAPDAQRGDRMRHTAERPLLLRLLVEVGSGAAVMPSNPLGSGTAAATARGGAVNIDVQLAQQQQQHGQSVPQSQALTFNHPASSMFLPRLPHAPIAPTPRIFPAETHITERTPIFILAAHYYLTYPNGVCQLLDDVTAAILESAMCADNRSGMQQSSLRLQEGPYRGSSVILAPNFGSAVLRSPGTVDVTIVRRSADQVSYCVDRLNSAQWVTFDRPLTLPPGRWCVRAKSSTADESSSSTTAKVFTVQP